MRGVVGQRRTMGDTTTHHIPPSGDVVIHAPPEGWSWLYYQRAIQEYTRARGRAPRWITMHPDTLDALNRHLSTGQAKPSAPILTGRERPPASEARRAAGSTPESAALTIATRPDHDRTTIVLG